MLETTDQPTKPCPLCGARLPLGSTKCGACGGELVPGRARELAGRQRHAVRYRVGMYVTGALLTAFGMLGLAASFLGGAGGLVCDLIFFGCVLLLAVAVFLLRRWANYLLLVYFMPVAAAYTYFAVKDFSPPAAMAAAAGVVFTALAFFNLQAYRQSIIAGVDPRKSPADD